MLEEVLRHINNWFVAAYKDGEYTITDGSITLPFLLSGQYFRICGSVFNDGLHRYPATDLTDETFTGTVYALAVPKAVITLADDIAAWQEKNGDKAASPYVSESFSGVYSYTKGTDASTGGMVTWQNVFANRLNKWRKI